MTQAAGQDRRRSFRINDCVTLRMELLDDEARDRCERAFDERRARLALVNDYLYERDLFLPRMAAVQSRHPDVAVYLRQLEKKIDQLAGILQRRDLDLPARPTHEVNLSATGIRFLHDASLSGGARLWLEIVLYPELAVIPAIGRVVWSREDEAGHDVAVDFERIDPRDADLISRHNIRTQLHDLRRDEPDEA